MKPKISAIIPVYNREKLISFTLNSLLNQTYKNWECLIVDDGSSDNSKEIISTFLIDKRIKLFNRPDVYPKGANSCRNFGFSISNGEYIHWLDSDDLLHPKCYEDTINTIDMLNIDFIRFERDVFFGTFNNNLFTKMYNHDEPFYIGIEHLEQIITNEIPFNTCNIIWKKSSIGNEKFNQGLVYADEWEFYSRLVSNNLKGVSINGTFLFARKHEDSTTYEFYQNNPSRIQSKKEAIRLVSKNLAQKHLLTPFLLKYLVGLAIGFRDFDLLNEILMISNTTPKNKLYLKLKYYLFPGWKVYKRAFKKIS